MKNYKYIAYSSLVLLLLAGAVYVYKAVGDNGDFFAAVTSTVKSTDLDKAWKEGASSKTYTSICKVSASNVKIQNPNELTDIVGRAITLYTAESKGIFLDSKKQIYGLQTKFDSLGPLDALTAEGQLTPDLAEAALNSVSKKTTEIALSGIKTYVNTDGTWKTFEDEAFANEFYSGATSDTLVTAFNSKKSFKLKTAATKSSAAVYNGLLSSDETIALLTPFIGEEEAALQPKAPVKLSVKDGHFKKFDVVDNVVLGNLSFTVKEACTVTFGAPKIKIPSKATTISTEEGLDIIINEL